MTDISIRGARQNNLKDVDIDIPRNKIVLFTGIPNPRPTALHAVWGRMSACEAIQ